MKTLKKNIHFTTDISLYIRIAEILKFYEVLFCTILQRFVFSLKSSHFAYIRPYMHETFPTLGNEK